MAQTEVGRAVEEMLRRKRGAAPPPAEGVAAPQAGVPQAPAFHEKYPVGVTRAPAFETESPMSATTPAAARPDPALAAPPPAEPAARPEPFKARDWTAPPDISGQREHRAPGPDPAGWREFRIGGDTPGARAYAQQLDAFRKNGGLNLPGLPPEYRHRFDQDWRMAVRRGLVPRPGGEKPEEGPVMKARASAEPSRPFESVWDAPSRWSAQRVTREREAAGLPDELGRRVVGATMVGATALTGFAGRRIAEAGGGLGSTPAGHGLTMLGFALQALEKGAHDAKAEIAPPAETAGEALMELPGEAVGMFVAPAYKVPGALAEAALAGLPKVAQKVITTFPKSEAAKKIGGALANSIAERGPGAQVLRSALVMGQFGAADAAQMIETEGKIDWPTMAHSQGIISLFEILAGLRGIKRLHGIATNRIAPSGRPLGPNEANHPALQVKALKTMGRLLQRDPLFRREFTRDMRNMNLEEAGLAARVFGRKLGEKHPYTKIVEEIAEDAYKEAVEAGFQAEPPVPAEPPPAVNRTPGARPDLGGVTVTPPRERAPKATVPTEAPPGRLADLYEALLARGFSEQALVRMNADQAVALWRRVQTTPTKAQQGLLDEINASARGRPAEGGERPAEGPPEGGVVPPEAMPAEGVPLRPETAQPPAAEVAPKGSPAKAILEKEAAPAPPPAPAQEAKPAPAPEPPKPQASPEPPAAEAAPPEVPAASAPTPPKKGPTPDRVFNIGRGTHGQVRVVFPDATHADLYAYAGRVRRALRAGSGRPNTEHLLRMLGETDERSVFGASNKYRETVAGGIKNLKEGEVWEAPGYARPTAPEAAPSAIAPEAAPPPPKPPPALGTKKARVIAGDQKREVTFGIRQADEILTSYDEGYPPQRQPRERGDRKAYEILLEKRARTVDVDRMGESATGSPGAPLVDPAGIADTNGRIRMLRLMYEKHPERAEEYRRFVAEKAEEFGIKVTPEQLARKPVLTRERGEIADPKELRAWIIALNQSEADKMAGGEQAGVDAGKITSSMIDALKPGEDGNLDTTEMRAFHREFMKNVVPEPEWVDFMDTQGQISADGIKRVRNAILARAFTDADVLRRAAESTDDNVKSVTNALVATAPRWIRLKAGIEEEAYHPLDISSEIAAAARHLSRLRGEKKSVSDFIEQMGLFGKEDPVVLELLGAFGIKKNGFTSAQRLADLLSNYTEIAQDSGGPRQGNLLGPPPTKGEILQAAIKVTRQQHGTGAPLFEGRPEEGAKAHPEPPAEEARAPGGGAEGKARAAKPRAGGKKRPVAAKTQARLSRASLKTAFNLTDEQAEATAAVADAMGLDADRIDVAKGGTAAKGALKQVVYHGSPYIFTRFDIQKIGGGQGAQTYGHGLYFAEKPETAEAYRRTLTTTIPGEHEGASRLQIEGVPFPKGRSGHEALDTASDIEMLLAYKRMVDRKEIPDGGVIALIEQKIEARRDRFIRRIAKHGEERGSAYDDMRALLEFYARHVKDVDPKRIVENLGATYKVDIDDAALKSFLDWDRSLAEQASVRRALESAGIGVGGNESGEALYKRLVDEVPLSTSRTAAAQAISARLNAAGIKGIRYADAGSRGKQPDGGTSNFVVFDDSIVKVLDRNGRPVEKGPTLFQKKGTTLGITDFRDYVWGGKVVIHGFKTANVSTAVHELAHVARRMLLDANVPAEDRRGITDADIEVAEKWAGAKNGKWTRPAEEKFARGFERYLSDGKAPNEGLARVFESFKNWLIDIYKSISGSAIDIDISPEMRAVFDKLMTRREQLDAAALGSRVPPAPRAEGEAPQRREGPPPPLEGSPTQIKLASDLRDRTLGALDAMAANAAPDRKAQIEAARNWAAAKTYSKWWINQRNLSADDLIRQYALTTAKERRPGEVGAIRIPSLQEVQKEIASWETTRKLTQALGTRREFFRARYGPKRGDKIYERMYRHNVDVALSEKDTFTEYAKMGSDPKAHAALTRLFGPAPASRWLHMGRAWKPIAKRFGIAASEMPALFRAAEGIKDIDAQGNIIFGTQKRLVGPDGKLVKDASQPDGYAKEVRYTAAEGKAMWDALRPEAQEYLKWGIGELKAIKAMYQVVGSIEGYQHHFWSDGFMDGFRKLMFQRKSAAPRKFRSEAGGYVEHFEKALLKTKLDLHRQMLYQKTINSLVARMTEPITEHHPLKPGWKEISLAEYGPKMGRFVRHLAAKRQIPVEMWDEYVRYAQWTQDQADASNLARAVARYYRGNLLFAPGTWVTNILSGAIQYGTKVAEDGFIAALEVGEALVSRRGIRAAKVRKVMDDLVAPFQAMLPSSIIEVPQEIFGSRSNIQTQFIGAAQRPGSDVKVPGMDRVVSLALMPMGKIENYFKRVIAISELRAKGAPVNRTEALKHLGDLEKAIDTWAFNYANEPAWLDRFKRSTVGPFLVPFPTYGYKLSRMYTRYAGAANMAVRMPAQDRLARLLTLSTAVLLTYSLYDRRNDETGPSHPGIPTWLDKRMRFRVKREGNTETFLRSTKYPWANFLSFYEGAKETYRRGGDPQPLVEGLEDFLTTGPLVDGAFIFFGVGSRRDIFKPLSVRSGEALEGFFPFSRVTKGLRATQGYPVVTPPTMGQPMRVPATFGEVMYQAAPSPRLLDAMISKAAAAAGLSEVKWLERLYGYMGITEPTEVRTKKMYYPEVDAQTGMETGKIKEFEVPVILNASTEAYKFWLGVNLRDIDFTQYSLAHQKEIASIIRRIDGAPSPRAILETMKDLQQVDPNLYDRLHPYLQEGYIQLKVSQREYAEELMKELARREPAQKKAANQ